MSVDVLVSNMNKHLQQQHLQPLRTTNRLGAKDTGDARSAQSQEYLQEQQQQQQQLPPHDQDQSSQDAAIPAVPHSRRIPTSLSELSFDASDWGSRMPLARGVAGRPLDQTPALHGAQRATVECDVGVDSLAYWNHPQGDWDRNFVSPFRVPPTAASQQYYLTFTPDPGGWNNIRMSMEIIFVLAAATGRTLVLPPKEPLYLLHHDKEERFKGFADFYPLHAPEFQKRVKVISMKEFLEREGGPGGLVPIPKDKHTAIMNAADHCEPRRASDSACGPVWEHLETSSSNVYIPQISSEDTCLIFDEAVYQGREVDPDVKQHVQTICGSSRQHLFFDQELQQHKVLHFKAGSKSTRLLTHFYAMLHFTNPKIDHYYKRFVRDFLHYHDVIFCAAGKIVKAIQAEAAQRGFLPDENGAGGYSSMHIRRGDLQYKRVKIPAKEWYENTKEVWKPNEILYIATDERKKDFFDDLAAHHDLRFLDDYWELAGLGDLDGNYMGMIDTIVASRGRAFAGTFFSTFTAFITRMRGYHGLSMHDCWYSFLPRKNITHSWLIVDGPRYAYEWPDGWVGIDADEWPSHDVF